MLQSENLLHGGTGQDDLAAFDSEVHERLLIYP